jgi:hypothetical protein
MVEVFSGNEHERCLGFTETFKNTTPMLYRTNAGLERVDSNCEPLHWGGTPVLNVPKVLGH